MSKYLVKYDEWTEVSEQTGTIQNIDDGCPIEVSTIQVEGSGVILYPWEMKPFSNVQLYVRGYNKNPLPTEVRVVPFEVGQGGGGGGGSYVLPTATATRLGGVKIGQGITVAADGTISANGAGIGTWAANTPYPVGIYVTYNDDLYLCTTAHTSTATFDSSKWKKIGCDGCKIKEWSANTDYDAGDYITYQNDLYLCLNQHTSGSTFDPTKWKLIGGTGSGIDFWASNTDYVAGNYVTYQDDLYLCTTAHTSGSTFDNSKWKKIGGIYAWKTNTDYVLGDYVTYKNKLYLCITAHTSSTKFAPTKWQEIGELPIATATTLGGVKIGDGISVSNDGTISWSGIPEWAAATAYSAGEYVTYNDDLYLCTTAHTSTTTFDDSKWKLIGCDGCKIKSWAANTDYDAGDYVTYQNDLYLCTTAHTSGAAFDSTKWKMVGELPIASSSTLGGVKIGQGITVAPDGTISSDGGIAEWETAKGYDVGSYVTVYNYGRQEWQDDTAYSAGDFVTNGGNLYKCIVSHTAGSIFANDLAANKWVQVPREGGLYICVKAHTSNDFHDDFVVDGKWNAIRNGIDFWSTTKHYEIGQYVTVPDHYKYDEWQANTSYAIGDIVTVYNRGKSEWTTGTSYAVGDYATMGKALYRCETAHTSSTFANDVAAGDWTLVDTIVEQFSCLDSHTSSSSFSTDFGAGKWKSETPKMETCICLQEHISDDFAANFAAGKWQEIGGIAKVMTGATSSANGASGLVPAPSAGDDEKALFGDGTWKSAGADLPEWQPNTAYKAGKYLVHDGTTYKVVNDFTSGTTFSDTDLTPYVSPIMKGATSSADGEAGMVPESTTADINKFLCGDGTWKTAVGIGNNPVPLGTIIQFMGINPPGEYLACDGTIYNIADYDDLADFFKTQFGAKNHFGGDGTTTFAVPDLRGEFLRGTGTNSHTNQGSGANVGEHQDGTSTPYLGTSGANKTIYNLADIGTDIMVTDYDSRFKRGTSTNKWVTVTGINENTGEIFNVNTSRPTNTSILYCIKYTKESYEPQNVYSTTEKRIGTWIDGKPLYQKTFVSTNVTVVAKTDFIIGVLTGFDKVINISPIIHWHDSYGTVSQLNLYSGATGTNAMTMNNTYIGSFSMYTSGANSGDIVFTNNINASGIDFYITIKYTKT